MDLLADDNPRILSCCGRYGVDVVLENGQYVLRSANMGGDPEYYDEKKKNGTPINYFSTMDMDVLKVAISPENLIEMLQLRGKAEAKEVVQQAILKAKE